MTSWDYHTGWCLLVPLIALYHKLIPSLSGVVLYFRVIYLLFTGLNAVIIASLLKDKNNRDGGDVGLYIFPVLFFVPFSIFQINYNTFVIQVLSLISVMLFTSQKNETETNAPFRLMKADVVKKYLYGWSQIIIFPIL